MIPKKFAPVLSSLLLSGLLSLLVSGVSTIRLSGPQSGFMGLWLSAWLTAWLAASPAVLVAAPLTRKVVERVTA